MISQSEALVLKALKKAGGGSPPIEDLENIGARRIRSGKSSRLSFARLKTVIDPPHLLDIQKKLYDEFLQFDIAPEKRKEQGLHALFMETFPIKSYDDKHSIEFVSYKIGIPKYDVLECRKRGMTYQGSLNAVLRLRSDGTVKEEEVYMGNMPLMTKEGTFIINGAERVIVSQLHRSPGICFEQELHPRGIILYKFRIIPYRGSWMEAQFDVKELIYIYMDRRRRRRKILATTLLRAIGYSTDEDILEAFFGKDDVDLGGRSSEKEIVGKFLARNVVNQETGEVMAGTSQKITKDMLPGFVKAGVKSIEVLKDAYAESPVFKMLEVDTAKSRDEALREIYKKLRPGDPITLPNARALLKRLFFDPKRYDLGRVGRFKLNSKLGLPVTEEKLKVTTLRKNDMLEALKYLIALKEETGKGSIDDIDHLGNRRIRSVGELLYNQCRIGMARVERSVRERMSIYDMESETISPHKLINPKGLSTVIRDFFGRSQLSQFMDQTNPLAELTHKRRLSALGPGGLSRERAGFEVRDVHTSHYGRICPIETPEGPNIGLISSLSTYARINQFGFVETPYRKVVNCRATNRVEYLTADEEENYIIAQANARLDPKGKFMDEKVSVRYKGDFLYIGPKDIQYMDVSPMQLVSVAAGLIPFLEHDDANRALMGSNMQRQAVPLLTTEPPLVATGMEGRVAVDSGNLILAEESGRIAYVDADKIVLGGRTYRLIKNMRSNAGTCINQRPVVKEGEYVRKGQVIADGPGTCRGELALGRNVLAAFMPWGGYNFEDAILISQSLLHNDRYSSILIEEFEIGARDTKLGREEITRDIPNVGEEALKDLCEDGVVRIGAEVKPGDILVGKITPKSETELSPEERLLRAIFGEKAADVKDASLRVPSGTEGIVMDVRVFSRKEKAKDDEEELEEKLQLKQITDRYKADLKRAKGAKLDRITKLLLGTKLSGEIVDEELGNVVVPANRKVTKKMISQLTDADIVNLDIPDPDIRKNIQMIWAEYEHIADELKRQQDSAVEHFTSGDELEPGVIKKVKVYVVCKRKLSVGDKIAGRHGNKGVIAKILPVEDMPYLPDGTPVEIVLNPLGVPSRMNIGQIIETHLGWAAKLLGLQIATPVFDGIREHQIKSIMAMAGLPSSGKTVLYDGRSGERFDQEVTIGYIYIMKLLHLVDDKIHARAIGPYSLVTQQPLGGKAQFGGQRFGEMEVWALEAYGAAYALQEMLTVKSDDVAGRTRIYESIVKGANTLEAGTPESFNVLIKEIQSLCLDIRAEK